MLEKFLKADRQTLRDEIVNRAETAIPDRCRACQFLGGRSLELAMIRADIIAGHIGNDEAHTRLDAVIDGVRECEDGFQPVVLPFETIQKRGREDELLIHFDAMCGAPEVTE